MWPYFAYIIYAIIGIFAGFLGGLFGIGGGIIVVPSLLFAFDLLGFSPNHAMQVAIGTSLAAMVFTSASSSWAHYQHKGIYWNLVISFTPGIMAGAVLGALIADYLPAKILAIFFGIFLSLVGLHFLLSKKIQEGLLVNQEPLPHFLVTFFLGLAIGTISSVLGIGGGIITVPLFLMFHTPLKNAISTSAFTGFLIALVGALSFLYFGSKREVFSESAGYIYLPAFIFISIASVLSAPYGAKLRPYFAEQYS